MCVYLLFTFCFDVIKRTLERERKHISTPVHRGAFINKSSPVKILRKPLFVFETVLSVNRRVLVCMYLFLQRAAIVQRVPQIRSFHYRKTHSYNFWLMYAQVGYFHISRGPPTVPFMQILGNAAFSSSKISVRLETFVNFKPRRPLPPPQNLL